MQQAGLMGGLFLSIAACASTGSRHGEGAEGQSGTASPPEAMELVADCSALIRISATSTQTGIEKEYKWIETNYPGATPLGQALTDCGGIAVDVIQIRTAAGEIRNISFDISSFFGKIRGRNLDDLLDG